MGIDIDNLEIAVGSLLREYGDLVYQATEEGLTAAENVLIQNLKTASPRSSRPKQKGFKHFADSWKSKGKKYKMRRYVGNTKVVPGRKGEIPLSNILEYGTKSPHRGFIKRTYLESVEQMAAAIVAEIKKEV
jgi:hypothetical protein